MSSVPGQEASSRLVSRRGRNAPIVFVPRPSRDALPVAHLFSVAVVEF